MIRSLSAATLVGKVVVRALPEGLVSGRIVETEAYVPGDAAGHAYRGMTGRNRSLFLDRGHAYVYLAYGISYMLNVASEMAGLGAGVLIRALEPLDGIPVMRLNRGIETVRDLARGTRKARHGVAGRSSAGRSRPVSRRPLMARTR